MKQLNHLILPIQKINVDITLLSQSSVVYKFVVLLILKKQSALNDEGQKNMPTKIMIKIDKVPFMNTCWHVDITTA